MSDAPEMDLFLRAIDLQGEARTRFLSSIDDTALREKVTELLRADEQLGERDPFSHAIAGHAERALSPLVGAEIDGYTIVREVGRGGMGVVYEAQQQSPRRRVAFKTLPFTAANDDDSQRRLAREAETLARLSHPGIAQVFGCGRAARFDGVPYLVMEFVDGMPLDAYVRRADLDVAAKIELLARICDAVAHAHELQVVHRDLKPQNVLVQPDGQPVVLDFGIARVLDGDLAHSLRTRTGQVMGTLAYMAPEQLTGTFGEHGPSARVDVYGLGVLGFELFAGRLPIDLPNGPLATVIRHVTETEAPSLGSLDAALRGDVEVVIGKAIDKDPARRYEDAAALGRDLRRILASQPVVARAPSAAYHVRKFVRRNRTAVGAVGAIMLSLAGGLVWALQERSLAQVAQRDAEGIARLERRRAQSMGQMVDLLGQLVQRTTPLEDNGEPETMESVVNTLSMELDQMYEGEPFVRGSAHLMLVEVMCGRGEHEVARFHLKRARVELAQSELLDDRTRVLMAIAECKVAEIDSRHDDALAQLDEARRIVAGVDDASLAARIDSMHANLLAELHRDLPRAEQLIRGVMAQLDEQTPAWRGHQRVLARVLGAMDRGDEAIVEWQRSIALAREHLPGSLRLAAALQNLGLYYEERGDADRAFPLLSEALDIRREVFRDRPHPQLGVAIDNFAITLRWRGELERSLELSREAERIFRMVHAEPHMQLGVSLTEQGITLRDLRRLDEARGKLSEAVELFEQLGGEATPQHAAALEHFANVLAGPEVLQQRIELVQRAIAMRKQIHGPEHFLVARPLEVLAQVQLSAENMEAAEQAGRECIDIRLRKYGESDWRTWLTGAHVWIPMVRRGEHAEAALLIERAIDATETSLGTHSTARVRFYLGHLRQVRELQGDQDAMTAIDARLQALPKERPPQGGR